MPNNRYLLKPIKISKLKHSNFAGSLTFGFVQKRVVGEINTSASAHVTT